MAKVSFREKKKKLAFLIPFRIICTVVVIIAIMCVIMVIRQADSTQKLANDKVQYLAQNNAYLVSSYLNNMQTMSNSMADELTRDNVLKPETKDELIRKNLATMLDDKRIFSAYVAFEPNLYFSKTPNGLSYYEYNDSGSKKLDVNNDYSTYSTADYYAQTKSTMKPHITDPYTYKLSNGQTVWLITISNPILDDSGKFLGVANTDIMTDTLNSLSYNKGGYSTSDNVILTESSVYVCDTGDKTKSGTKFTGSADGGRVQVVQPVQVNNVTSKWTSTFSVGKSEVLRDVVETAALIAGLSILAIIALSLIVVRLLKRSLAPIQNIVALTSDMGEGKLDTDIQVNTNDELGELAAISKNTCGQLRGYIAEISNVLGSIADGDLRVAITQDYVGDFAPIKTALLQISNKLNSTFTDISHSADEVASGSSQVASGAQALAQGATEQASSLEELSATITEISSHVKTNAVGAEEADNSMNGVRAELETSNSNMSDMVTAMNHINESSRQIGNIIKTIEDIAFQTNILALNAAVEAARAGEAGKGFSVVADEVRNLASKSAEAAQNTTDLIQNTVNQVENGAQIADRTAQSLSAVDSSIKEVSAKIQEISVASQQQAEAISQVTTGVDQISSVVQTNSATAEESSAASEELSGQAQMMKSMVSNLKLNDTGYAEGTNK
ncbi:methyl-accepting chemotaxis protein [Caproicibacterium amylolyticum]|nr:methyl-accepting chemotaxis protein [Caproicibacterium amylolyticum]